MVSSKVEPCPTVAAVVRAIEFAGTRRGLARICSKVARSRISHQHICYWEKHGVPGSRARLLWLACDKTIPLRAFMRSNVIWVHN